MRLFRRRSAASGERANDIATHAVGHSGGGRAAAIISAIALVFSGYSLWETSLKQADLTAYLTGAVTYTTDPFGSSDVQEAGGHEVLAVPVTIANSGARDAAVLSLNLGAKNTTTGKAARFDAAYMADGAYFATPDKGKRPKTPFAALVVAGRSAWSGTVLFYSDDYKTRVITPKDRGRVELTLTALTAPASGWLERMFGGTVPPVRVALDVPEFSDPFAGVHAFARLRSASAAP
jgi:hypothetical protein